LSWQGGTGGCLIRHEKTKQIWTQKLATFFASERGHMKYRSRVLTGAFLAGAVLFSGSAQSGFFDGNDLYRNCTSEQTILKRGFCNGYAAAVVDMMIALQQVGGDFYGHSACIPENVKLQQVSDIVLNYLKSNPVFRHQAGAWLAAQAISQAWPCSGKK